MYVGPVADPKNFYPGHFFHKFLTMDGDFRSISSSNALAVFVEELK